MINIIAKHLRIYSFTVLFHTVEDYTKPQASCCDTDKLLEGLTSVGWAPCYPSPNKQPPLLLPSFPINYCCANSNDLKQKLFILLTIFYLGRAQWGRFVSAPHKSAGKLNQAWGIYFQDSSDGLLT